MRESIPTLNDLGKDLLHVSAPLVYLSLVFPFILALGYFSFCASGQYFFALLSVVLLSFFTYGSISHDLVHRTLGIPRFLNEALLCAIELLTLRSGHVYRASHLNHHAKFPSSDDLEGAAASMTFLQSLIDGFTLQYRIWYHVFCTTTNKSDRLWIYGESAAIVILFVASVMLIPLTIYPAVYGALVIAGSWIFPLVTSWIPHNGKGVDELTKTRLFRGTMIRLISLDHLYHLEHHLYPQVPHHKWPELARRLEPHFQRLNIPAIKLWF